MTMQSLLELGYHAEARAFLNWLLHATHLTWPKLRVLYDVFGRTECDEQNLDHLSGYRCSRPVRIGNQASHQLQLDVYGEVIGATHEFVMRGGRLAMRLPAQGYIDAAAPRMQSTYAYLKAQLCQNGLWYRYCADESDGLSGGEGTFGICGFWAAEYLARRGETAAAKAAFEHVLTYANDVGLFAEEIDPETGAALGNFPQAFTHIGLINAALALTPQETRPSKSD